MARGRSVGTRIEKGKKAVSRGPDVGELINLGIS